MVQVATALQDLAHKAKPILCGFSKYGFICLTTSVGKKLLRFWYAICKRLIKLWVFNRKARKTGVNLPKESIMKKLYTKLEVTITPRKKFNFKFRPIKVQFLKGSYSVRKQVL